MRPTFATHPGGGLSGGARPANWWHTDQAPGKTGLHCVQGLLNLSDVGPHAGEPDFSQMTCSLF